MHAGRRYDAGAHCIAGHSCQSEEVAALSVLEQGVQRFFLGILADKGILLQ